MNSASSNADAGSPVLSGSPSQRVPSSPGPSRTQHIHFPSESVSPSSKAPSSPARSAAGLHSLETSSRSDANRAALDIDSFERRRVRSTLGSESLRPFGSYSRSQYLADSSRSRTSGRRAVSHSLHSSDRSNTRGTSSIGSSPLTGGVLLPSENANVDQGDDPNILADLHKALQFKPHVEQHLKEAKPYTDYPSSLPSISGPSSNAPASPFSTKGVLPFSEPNTPDKAEFIDFSPSTGKSTLHPVPKSSDDGATLDWSGSMADDEKHEKKWTMPLPRLSSKDKKNPLSRKALVEQQDVQYSNKLSRIKANLNEHTVRKAEITRDQLQRRYAAFSMVYNSSGSNLNLAEVARWYDKQHPSVKSQIGESESMPWLRHLSKRGRGQQECRSPWNLSAMIVDHYVRSQSDTELSPPMSMGNEASDAASPSSAVRYRQASKPTSLGSFDDVFPRQPDEMISFELMTQPQRDSLGTESHVSVDTQLKRWRQSLLNRADHDASSESSISRKRTTSLDQRNPQTGRNSSASALSPLHTLGMTKFPRRSPGHSDDGHSSAADSMADMVKGGQESDGKFKKKASHEKRRGRFPLSLDLRSAQHSQGDSKNSPAPISIADLRTDASRPEKTQSLPVGKEGHAARSVDTFDDVLSSNNHLGSPVVLSPARKTHDKRAQKLSVPPVFQTPQKRRGRPDTRTEAQNHALRVEYNRKQELLDALLARNQRMKSLLQIASRSITDYDETQSAICDKLGLTYSRLPPEVLEALRHDPSVSTGHLRHQKGWRAVEDIHHRREQQKQILHTFVASLPETVTPLSLPKDGIYEIAIASLRELVDRLHDQRDTVLSHVRQTQELLSKVKNMRDVLKPEFDETSRHTSVNYPELVHLESLLDELVNETNHLWRFAEASLSFLLASVAPIMKTFGRPVWDELHDFLIIPLYRNGFSGEDHWYPVSFPRRGVTQWLRLLLVAACAPALLYHGCRAFVALLTHGYVLRIPSYIPTFVIYIVFSSIMCAFGSVLSGLFIAVLCEMFIVFWWTLWLLHIVQ